MKRTPIQKWFDNTTVQQQADNAIEAARIGFRLTTAIQHNGMAQVMTTQAAIDMLLAQGQIKAVDGDQYAIVR